jgi:hypothetical protein
MRYENSGQDQKDYFAYLLRMWREDNGDGMPYAAKRLWRASLQSPGSSKQIGFSSLQELFDFLSSQAGIEPVAKNGKED